MPYRRAGEADARTRACPRWPRPFTVIQRLVGADRFLREFSLSRSTAGPKRISSAGNMKTPASSGWCVAVLWLLVLSWAVALGAKIFDLLVVAMAWGASPPASFQYLPYGKAYPIDPGNFFQPLSALILLTLVAALALGWRTSVRRLVVISLASFLVIWAFTPTVFWPMITELWEIHRGRLSKTDLEIAALVHRWFVWDSGRIVLIGIGFVYSVKALVVGKASRIIP
ncbi:hypothetical protein DB347_22595 [Opitutaceae bacterium EW11]|nr:hypothetical protein DB347_22595 [Opitutaceae bacterium EW11]